MGFLSGLLGLLPGNNWKTVIGFLALALHQLFPDFSHWEIVDQILVTLGLGYGSAGVVHKIVKAKLK